MIKDENKNNICGEKIARLRKQMKPKCSQRQLAEKLQILNLDIDKNAIQRIECGKRFVTDIEIIAFCRVFNMKPSEFLSDD
jgi:transcriptional regulator with XRE-family HTH domain